MKLSSLKSAEKRARFLAKTRKSLLHNVRSRQPGRAVFIAGMQRSGTTMLMNVFHLRPDTAVFDEARDSVVFQDFRIRDLDVLRNSLDNQSLPVSVYKVICDSHCVSSLLESFPNARVLWVYRNPQANADSQLKKFASPVQAIKLVHGDQPGGGWFAEGVSDEVRRVLQQFDPGDLADFDWACLNWWARNQIFVEQNLRDDSRVELLRYEELVVNPRTVLGQVIDWLEMPNDERSFRFVHTRSVHKRNLPSVHPEVDKLCNLLLDELNVNQRFVTSQLSGRQAGEAM
jgi:sulfotransferase family protein